MENIENEIKGFNKDFEEEAENFVNYFNNQQVNDIRIDYSVESLRIIDSCLDILRKQNKDRNAVMNEIYAIGFYLGEVIKRNLGGWWTKHTLAGYNDDNCSFDYVFIFENGHAINILGKVLKRFTKGEEHNLFLFYRVAKAVSVLKPINETKRFKKLKVGDEVIRYLANSPMALTITEITDECIICGSWKFDKFTGAEIDEELNWDNKGTGSYINVFE
jgi:hypothetical protein